MKLNDVDLNKLNHFMEVVRAGGVSKAAAKLNLTPSAISQSLRALESAFDTLLFDRVGKQLVLTSEGKTLAQSLGKYQEGLEETFNLLKGGLEKVRGRVRLGIFYGFSQALAARFLAELKREHPALEVDVIFAAPSELDRLLQYKKIDFAINLFKTSGKLPLKETALTFDELWLVSSQPPPTRSLSFTELKQAPFIDYYRKSHLIASWISHHFGKKVRDIPITMYAAHSEMVVQLILQGVGIGIVASSIAKPYVTDRKLFVIRGKKKQLESQIWLKELHGVPVSAPRSIVKTKLLQTFVNH